jgi:hypothetical protein
VVGSIPSDSTHSLSVPRSGQCLSGHRCMFFVYSFLSINLVIHSGSFFLALVILDGTCFSAKSFVLARLLDLCFGHYSFPSCCATFGHISYIGSPFVYFFTALVFPLSPWYRRAALRYSEGLFGHRRLSGHEFHLLIMGSK